MRELEFLPGWYHQSRRCKRIVLWQTYAVAALVVALGTWIVLTQRAVRADQHTLDSLEKQLDRTRIDQQVLDEKLALRQKLVVQEELLASVGYSIEMTRLLQKLDELMPKQMSLIDFECTTEETLRPVASVAAVRNSGEKPKPQYDRRLRIRLLGVAPNNSDVATFVAGLYQIPYLDQVAYVNSRNIYEAGHELREFTITFCVNLNP